MVLNRKGINADPQDWEVTQEIFQDSEAIRKGKYHQLKIRHNILKQMYLNDYLWFVGKELPTMKNVDTLINLQLKALS